MLNHVAKVGDEIFLMRTIFNGDLGTDYCENEAFLDELKEAYKATSAIITKLEHSQSDGLTRYTLKVMTKYPYSVNGMKNEDLFPTLLDAEKKVKDTILKRLEDKKTFTLKDAVLMDEFITLINS